MLLIGNGKVITRDSANPCLENGAVVTDGENIKEVGTRDAMKQKYPELCIRGITKSKVTFIN